MVGPHTPDLARPVGEMAAAVAHNVRNPLASIRAVSQTLVRDPEADETVDDDEEIDEEPAESSIDDEPEVDETVDDDEVTDEEIDEAADEEWTDEAALDYFFQLGD